MKRFFRILAIGFAGLVFVVAIGVTIANVVSHRREATRYRTRAERIVVPTDPSSLEEGARLYTTRGCAECHGARGEGRVVLDAPIGRFVAANLTDRARHSDADFARAVRHGIRADGTPLRFMPSPEYWSMSNRDVGLILAYVRSLPRVDRPLPESELRPLGRVLHVLGAFPAIPAERIDHDAERPAEVPVGETVEYGRYLAIGCTGCHGEGFSGGPIPFAPPELGTPRNLTPHASGLARWSEEDFARAMRTGRTPDGRQLDARQMPYPTFAGLTGVEMRALYRFLRTLPPRPFGGR